MTRLFLAATMLSDSGSILAYEKRGAGHMIEKPPPSNLSSPLTIAADVSFTYLAFRFGGLHGDEARAQQLWRPPLGAVTPNDGLTTTDFRGVSHG
jgi:hypothetical protein